MSNTFLAPFVRKANTSSDHRIESYKHRKLEYQNVVPSGGCVNFLFCGEAIELRPFHVSDKLYMECFEHTALIQ